ncbi:MAG: DUF2634 domain-containing protein [Lachnospiraceae bacterium]
MATLPDQVDFQSALQYVNQPTNTFVIDWESRQIAGMDSGLAAMRQAVEIILQNERFRWQVYNSNFGSEFQDLPGEEYDYIKSEIPRRVEEAFSMDNRILSVENYEFEEPADGTIRVTFDVITVFGDISQEVKV